jgi:hypothetical protein
MRRPSTLDGQGPIDTNVLRPDTSRPHRAIRKHGGDLRRSKRTRRRDRTRIGRRGGGSRKNSRTDARRRHIRLASHVSYTSTRLTCILYIISHRPSVRLNALIVSIARKLRPRSVPLSLFTTQYLLSIGSPCDRLEASRNNLTVFPSPTG